MTLYQKRNARKRNNLYNQQKTQCKMRDLIFLISEGQRNFHNQLFDSVEAQHDSAIAEQHFRTKLKP